MRRSHRFTILAVLAAAALLAGCAVEWQNRQARATLAREAAPAGSAYAGWRVFQARCARCHGTEATGSANAPDLTVTLRQMGPRRFVGRVLQYESTVAVDDAQAEQVMQRREAAMQMPAWGTEPEVSAHVMDLYAYLVARAEGTLGPGRPPR